MPLPRLALILIAVIAAAAATNVVAVSLAGILPSPWPGLSLLSVVGLVAYLIVRREQRRDADRRDRSDL